MEDKEGKRTNPPTSGCSRLSARTRCVYGNGNSAQTHQNPGRISTPVFKAIYYIMAQ